MQINIRRTHPRAQLPKHASAGAACFDLSALDAGEVGACGGVFTFRTGLSFEIPAGHVMLVLCSRNGHGFKHGIRLANGAGVIDSDYRGEVMVGLRNDSPLRFEVKEGDRVAQALIVPLPSVQFVEVDTLGDTDRGAGGFGSTGVCALTSTTEF